MRQKLLMLDSDFRRRFHILYRVFKLVHCQDSKPLGIHIYEILNILSIVNYGNRYSKVLFLIQN